MSIGGAIHSREGHTSTTCRRRVVVPPRCEFVMMLVATTSGQATPRTEALISTTKTKTTMTTEIKVEFVEDAIADNDVCTLQLSALPGDTKVGAAAWLTDQANDDARSAVLNRVLKCHENANLTKCLWIVFGDPTWQADSRIARHGGLWGRLSRRGLDVGSLHQQSEWVDDRDTQFRAFGAAIVSPENVSATVSVLETMNNGYLLSSTSDSSVAYGALQNRWENGPWFDYSLLSYALKANALLWKPVGSFDDPEVGFVCVGHPESIRPLTS